jgi:hypothetical protein
MWLLQVMDKQLHELAFSIQQKEELIEVLARNESEAKHLTAQYENRMLKLAAEVHHHHLLLVCLILLAQNLSTSTGPQKSIVITSYSFAVNSKLYNSMFYTCSCIV